MPQRIEGRNRLAKSAAKQTIKSYAYQRDNEENFESFSKQLNKIGLKLRDIPGDGNCLFRALGDQIDGNSNNHFRHREETVNYMIHHRGDFEPFVEDDVTFDFYINNLRQLGTYAGNDAIVAFARNNNVDVVIHQLNTPLWTIKGSNSPNNKQLHISYHNGDHYSSVRKCADTYTSGPSNIKMTKKDANANSSKTLKHKTRIPGSFQGYVRYVCDTTGCKDEELVYETLKDVDYDQSEAVAKILEIVNDEDENNLQPIATESTNNGIWDQNGSGTRIFGNTGTSSQPKPKLSNKKRKEQARKERKKKSDERKRTNQNGDSLGSNDEITANLSMLHI